VETFIFKDVRDTRGAAVSGYAIMLINELLPVLYVCDNRLHMYSIEAKCWIFWSIVDVVFQKLIYQNIPGVPSAY